MGRAIFALLFLAALPARADKLPKKITVDPGEVVGTNGVVGGTIRTQVRIDDKQTGLRFRVLFPSYVSEKLARAFVAQKKDFAVDEHTSSGSAREYYRENEGLDIYAYANLERADKLVWNYIKGIDLKVEVKGQCVELHEVSMGDVVSFVYEELSSS